MTKQDDVLKLWVVYDHPRDHPSTFIARLFVIRANESQPTSEYMTAPRLGMIRAEMMRRGLVCLPRDPSDDPKIVESWI